MHPGLTMTGMYNVLEKLRAGEALSDKEKRIHGEGLVSILKQIHDDLDEAVFEAYGWEDLHAAQVALGQGGIIDPQSGTETMLDSDLESFGKALREHGEVLEQELLNRLVALNHERAAEEKRGLVRWLRPEYQAPEEAGISKLKQDEIELEAGKAAKTGAALPEKLKWPVGLAAQVGEIQKLLPATGPDPAALAACFGKRTKARVAQIEEILETLRSLGKLEG